VEGWGQLRALQQGVSDSHCCLGPRDKGFTKGALVTRWGGGSTGPTGGGGAGSSWALQQDMSDVLFCACGGGGVCQLGVGRGEGGRKGAGWLRAGLVCWLMCID
jgi:hypothetical protein